jgi:hypothetical protein
VVWCAREGDGGDEDYYRETVVMRILIVSGSTVVLLLFCVGVFLCAAGFREIWGTRWCGVLEKRGEGDSIQRSGGEDSMRSDQSCSRVVLLLLCCCCSVCVFVCGRWFLGNTVDLSRSDNLLFSVDKKGHIKSCTLLF